MSIGIYKITSPSGKIYIGQSTNIEKRFLNYNTKNCNRQKQLFESFLEFGINNHKFEIIEECEIINLKYKEKFWINFHDSYKNGLNRNKGGGGIVNHTKESKDKISRTKLDNPRNTTQSMIEYFRENSPLKKKVYQYNLEGNFIKEWQSIGEASRILNIPKDNISLCIRKRQQTGSGFQWFDKKQELVLPIKKYQKPKNWIGRTNLSIEIHVKDIEKKYQMGYNVTKISREYNVHRDVIRRILKLK